MEPLYLGLDASTQSLKASLLSENLDVRAECAIHFDTDLPHYKTKGGVIFGENGQVYSPVMMLVEAFDILFDKIKARNWDVASIKGVAGSGQQHASVYWSNQASSLLSNLDPKTRLVDQLSPAFSRSIVPNWQDSSTSKECQDFQTTVGGPVALAKITGSRAHERFTGPQILRFKRNHPDTYRETSRISLVSSAITTLLCSDGGVKGIDESDACGMNLWNVEGRHWEQSLLDLIGEDAGEKLGEVEKDAGKVVGHIGKWFVERYGFSPECAVFPGTGDNPATFLSLTLAPSEGLISLGTSDVVLVSTARYFPNPESHAFFHPARGANDSPSYFNMIVYKNGSLARQHVRDLYFEQSWDKFNAAVESLRPQAVTDLPNKAAFWWLLPDIVPHNAHGVFKYITDPSAGLFEIGAAQKVDAFPDVSSEALAILESQLFNYRSRSSTILDDSNTPAEPSTASLPDNIPRLTRVYATGGASANKTILSLMADVLSTKVCRNVEFYDNQWKDAMWNACSVGVAYKARWGYERSQGREITFDDLVAECRNNRAKLRGAEEPSISLEEEGIRVVAEPGEGARAYERRVDWWRALEHKALSEMNK
ncbi:hypothetical protein IAT40_002553 [Kwoniella sp. CBS 6097]